MTKVMRSDRTDPFEAALLASPPRRASVPTAMTAVLRMVPPFLPSLGLAAHPAERPREIWDARDSNVGPNRPRPELRGRRSERGEPLASGLEGLQLGDDLVGRDLH